MLQLHQQNFQLGTARPLDKTSSQTARNERQTLGTRTRTATPTCSTQTRQQCVPQCAESQRHIHARQPQNATTRKWKEPHRKAATLHIEQRMATNHGRITLRQSFVPFLRSILDHKTPCLARGGNYDIKLCCVELAPEHPGDATHELQRATNVPSSGAAARPPATGKPS